MIVRYFYIPLVFATLLILLRKRVYLQFPAFCGYLGACVCAAASFALGFTPQADSEWWLFHWVAWQPLLMLGLGLSIAEWLWWAGLRVYPKETRLLVLFGLSMGVFYAAIVYRALPPAATLVVVVAEVRRYFDLGMATLMIAACGWFAYRPVPMVGVNTKRHGWILTAFLAVNASTQLTVKLTGAQWRKWDTAAYALSACCLGLWSVVLKTVDRPSLPEFDPGRTAGDAPSMRGSRRGPRAQHPV